MFFFFFFFFYNLEFQNAWLADVKYDLNENRSKEIFVRENLKNKYCYSKCNRV